MHQLVRQPETQTDNMVWRAPQTWALVEERVVLPQAREEVEVEPAHMEVVNQQLEPQVEEVLQLEQMRLQAQQESTPLEEVKLQLQQGRVELLGQ